MMSLVYHSDEVFRLPSTCFAPEGRFDRQLRRWLHRDWKVALRGAAGLPCLPAFTIACATVPHRRREGWDAEDELASKPDY